MKEDHQRNGDWKLITRRTFTRAGAVYAGLAASGSIAGFGQLAPEAPLAGPEPSQVKRRWYADNLATQLKQLSVDPQLAQMKRLRERLAEEEYTPVFHFTAPHEKMNDPNGLCFWKGYWHLFYQAYPGSPRLHWGHAYSRDLARWTDLPVAIYPYKEHHACSGSTFVEDDQVVALYNGHPVGSMVAVSQDPLLLNWQSLEENPVIRQIKGQEKRVKDTCIWKEKDGYYAITPELHYSKDLKQWKRLKESMLDLSKVKIDGDAELSCPYFFPFGKGKDQYILVYFSHKRGGQYFLGDYDKKTHTFTPYYHDRFTRGPTWHGAFHAPSAFPDSKGGAYVIFNAAANHGGFLYNQIMSVPAHLTFGKDKMLIVQPAASLTQLRDEKSHVKLSPRTLPVDKEVVLEKVHGKAMDMQLRIDPRTAKTLELKVFRDPAQTEYTSIRFDLGVEEKADRVTLDVSKMSLMQGLKKQQPEVAPLRRKKGEPLDLRIFVDRCVVEVFINKQRWMFLRAYPTLENSDGVSIRATGSDARLLQFDSWKMRTIYEQ